MFVNTNTMNKPLSDISIITSRDNALIKEVRKLAHDNMAYRKQGRVWLEGLHLIDAVQTRRIRPAIAVFSESYWVNASGDQKNMADKNMIVSDSVFASISALESPAGVAVMVALPSISQVQSNLPTVVLDQVQDAGNVGSILRSAAAFGFQQVIAMKGSAALWSPKVVRAGMGAHFALHLVESVEVDILTHLQIPLLMTSSHQGEYLHQSQWPWPCGWVFGHEGQGVSQSVQQHAAHHVQIAQPGGEESLNVAAAAAICLHASGVVSAHCC